MGFRGRQLRIWPAPRIHVAVVTVVSVPVGMKALEAGPASVWMELTL